MLIDVALITAYPTWQWHFRKLFQSSKIKVRTSLLPRFSEKRLSSFELWALTELSKMSSQMGLAALRKKESSSFVGSSSTPMCSNLILDREYWFFPDTFSPPFWCVCKAFVSNKSLSSAPLNQAPAPGCRHSSCVQYTLVLVCVCFCICVWKCVGNVIEIWQL